MQPQCRALHRYIALFVDRFGNLDTDAGGGNVQAPAVDELVHTAVLPTDLDGRRFLGSGVSTELTFMTHQLGCITVYRGEASNGWHRLRWHVICAHNQPENQFGEGETRDGEDSRVDHRWCVGDGAPNCPGACLPTQMDKTVAGIRVNALPGVFSVTNNLRVEE